MFFNFEIVVEDKVEDQVDVIDHSYFSLVFLQRPGCCLVGIRSFETCSLLAVAVMDHLLVFVCYCKI